MRISAKGQLTIPQTIREKLGFLPETDVEFFIENDKLCLQKMNAAKKSRGDKIVERLKGRCKTRMTTEELMKLTRGE